MAAFKVLIPDGIELGDDARWEPSALGDSRQLLAIGLGLVSLKSSNGRLIFQRRGRFPHRHRQTALEGGG